MEVAYPSGDLNLVHRTKGSEEKLKEERGMLKFQPRTLKLQQSKHAERGRELA